MSPEEKHWEDAAAHVNKNHADAFMDATADEQAAALRTLRELHRQKKRIEARAVTVTDTVYFTKSETYRAYLLKVMHTLPAVSYDLTDAARAISNVREILREALGEKPP